MEKPNYYQILGVSFKASQKEITRTYRRLARRFHPDLQPPERKQWAGEQMKRFNEAYAVLGDPEARARYDVGAGLLSNAPPFREKWTAPFPEGWFSGVPFQARWRKSRRWRRFVVLADFLFGLLIVYFLMAGAYFIFVEWGLFQEAMSLQDIERSLEFASQEVKSQWIFAGIWYFVFLVTLYRAVPKRR